MEFLERFYALLVILASIVVSESHKCGTPLVSGFFHIYNGRLSIAGQWPWMTSILRRQHRQTEFRHICGGAVINEHWILTAAHCFDLEAHMYQVVVGQHDQAVLEKHAKTFGVEAFYNHYEFWTEQRSDIALVKVNGTIEYSRYVQPICLPDKDSPMDNIKCTIAGWGRTKTTRQSLMLQHVRMTILPVDECATRYDEGDFDRATNLCANNNQNVMSDACKGDSGGPLFCHQVADIQWKLYGVVSWGEMCGVDDNPPGVYTNVLPYLSWIETTIKAHEESRATTKSNLDR